jgi:hypothetical protein
MPTPSFWVQVTGSSLAQGDFLPDCLVPHFRPDFGQTNNNVPVRHYDLIVVTQSCDLQNKKISLVACSPIHRLEEFETINPPFANKGRWEEVRKGRVEPLHMLASTAQPDKNRDAFVVDFREIYSLPVEYLSDHANRMGPRWRLQPPYLEHFSQAFARFFMRVGLPSTIPAFK